MGTNKTVCFNMFHLRKCKLLSSRHGVLRLPPCGDSKRLTTANGPGGHRGGLQPVTVWRLGRRMGTCFFPSHIFENVRYRLIYGFRTDTIMGKDLELQSIKIYGKHRWEATIWWSQKVQNGGIFELIAAGWLREQLWGRDMIRFVLWLGVTTLKITNFVGNHLLNGWFSICRLFFF